MENQSRAGGGEMGRNETLGARNQTPNLSVNLLCLRFDLSLTHAEIKPTCVCLHCHTCVATETAITRASPQQRVNVPVQTRKHVNKHTWSRGAREASIPRTPHVPETPPPHIPGPGTLRVPSVSLPRHVPLDPVGKVCSGPSRPSEEGLPWTQ